MFDQSEIIAKYTRTDALADGELINVSKQALQAGIIYPTDISRNLWACHIDHGDPEGRLWDVLWMFRLKARNNIKDTMTFNVSFAGQLVTLLAVCRPGDNLEPVITIMLPEDL